MSVDRKMMIGIVLVMIFSASVSGTSKIWLVNTNITIGSRYWDTLVTIGRFSFNGSMTNSLALPSGTGDSEHCELLFPLDKLPAIPGDQLNETLEGSCVDEELVTKMDRVFWIDPRNWDTPLLSSIKPVPHIERIPCDYDRVRIPNTTSTFIILPRKPVMLTSFRFGTTMVSRNGMKKLSQDEYFARHFILKSSSDLQDAFNIVPNGCQEKNGCKCGTDSYEEEICAFVENDCVADSSCESPFKPRGHCCRLCGAAVMVWTDSEAFVYNKLQPVVQKFIEGEAEKMNLEVTWYMSKVSASTVQVVILPENAYSADLIDLAKGLEIYLEKTSNLGIEACWARNGGKVSGGQRGWSTIIIIFIGLAAVLISGILLAYVKKSKFIENGSSFFKGLNYKQNVEDKNAVNEINTVVNNETETDDEKSEKVEEIESTRQSELTIDLIDTSG